MKARTGSWKWGRAVAGVVVLGSFACDDTGARTEGSGDARASAGEDGGARPTKELDGAAPPRTSERDECGAVESGSASDPQSQPSGSSVFGRVVGGDEELYDPYRRTDCAIPAVTICLADTTTCTESDQAGRFVLSGLPGDTNVEITFEKPGFRSGLRLVELTRIPVSLNETRLRTNAAAAATFARAGIDVEPGLGNLVVVGLTAGEAIGGITTAGEATVELEPGGVTPLYSAGATGASGLSSHELVPGLSETRQGGYAIFVNLAPGDYAVHMEAGGVQCTEFMAGYGWGADASGGIAVKARAGFTTIAAAYCP